MLGMRSLGTAALSHPVQAQAVAAFCTAHGGLTASHRAHHHHTHVQPDRGALCAYWVAALTSALDFVSGCDRPSRAAAARWLLPYVIFYTGHAVPERVRPRLASAVARGLREPADSSGGADVLTMLFTALFAALRSDSVLSPGAKLLLIMQNLIVRVRICENVRVKMLRGGRNTFYTCLGIACAWRRVACDCSYASMLDCGLRSAAANH